MLGQKEPEELRSKDRIFVSLPAKLGDTNCVTRDMSTSAVFLETNASFNEGERVDFAIELDSPAGKLIIKCNGKIIRVEKRVGQIGLAVKIEDSVMQSAEGTMSMDSIELYHQLAWQPHNYFNQ